MFKNESVWGKLTIGALMLLLTIQSWLYWDLKGSKVVEVEAKICKAENVICSYSQQMTDLSTDSTPIYMCMEAISSGDSQ